MEVCRRKNKRHTKVATGAGVVGVRVDNWNWTASPPKDIAIFLGYSSRSTSHITCHEESKNFNRVCPEAFSSIETLLSLHATLKGCCGILSSSTPGHWLTLYIYRTSHFLRRYLYISKHSSSFLSFPSTWLSWRFFLSKKWVFPWEILPEKHLDVVFKLLGQFKKFYIERIVETKA